MLVTALTRRWTGSSGRQAFAAATLGGALWGNDTRWAIETRWAGEQSGCDYLDPRPDLSAASDNETTIMSRGRVDPPSASVASTAAIGMPEAPTASARLDNAARCGDGDRQKQAQSDNSMHSILPLDGLEPSSGSALRFQDAVSIGSDGCRWESHWEHQWDNPRSSQRSDGRRDVVPHHGTKFIDETMSRLQ